LIIGKFRDKQREIIKDNTINRKLDVISTIYTTCKKEWGYPVINPVLSIRRPKMPEPRTRRLTEREINLLLRGNHTSELLRTIIELALETGMRQGEILRIHPEHIKGNTLFIPIAKTKPRTIPLTKEALTILKHATLPFNIKQDKLTKQFKKLCEHYGIKNARFHDCRKNALTDFMYVRKLSVPETMLIAGHSDPRMLLRIYNNLKVQDVAKKLN
jgi:integrase